MSSQQLLKETQRAAGDENLTKWHQTLIEAGKELRTLQDVSILLPRYNLLLTRGQFQLIQVDEASLKQMQDRNQNIENDVQRYLERQKIEHAVRLTFYISYKLYSI